MSYNREGVSVLNPGLSWEEKLTSGKGWSYGIDLSITKEAGAFTGTVGYGLMWNWRKFDELNQGLKFPAKFDMSYDKSRNLYVLSVKPMEGDAISISTTFDSKEVSASDRIPFKSELSDITVERRGPLAIYSNYDFVFTYRLTFTDNPDEDNYYFLQWDEVDRGKDVAMGERDFTHELVFQKLADQIHGTLPGWIPYCPYGLPFSDRGINGTKHTLVLEEIVQAANGSSAWKKSQMKRKFKLYSISRPYYDYLVSVLVNQTDDKGIQGGMIDLGIADPVKVYSNIVGGIGILGCYSTSETEIDVIKIVGHFPEK